MTSKHLNGSLLLILLLSLPAFAQTPTPSPQTDEQRKTQKELEQRALTLLEDVVKDSESFKNAENRIRLKAMAANVLWPHDEARARTLFKEAMTSLADLLNNQEPEEEAPFNNRRMFEGANALRRDLMRMLGERDARLAREFLRATRPRSSQPNNARNALPDQQVEINLAMQIAGNDPKQALEIAEENLPRGLSYDFPQLVSTLREKDPEAAAKLASEIMSKLRTEKLDSSHVARQVAISLLREATEAPDDEDKNAKAVTPLLDQQALRELTDMLLTEALRPSSTSTDALTALQEMLPAVEKYATPSRVAQLRRTMAPQTPVKEIADGDEGEGEGVGDDVSYGNMSKYSTLFEKGTVDELLEAAAKAPEGMREMLYQRAATKVMEEGDAERARQLINEHIKDPDVRKNMISQLDELAALKAAQQGKIEQTRKMLAALRTNEERVLALSQLATAAALRGDKKIALQLLDEARGMIGNRAKNFMQMGAQLSVARAYASLDASRGLAILEPVVDQLNELLAAAVVLGPFITEEIIKDDEITMEPLAEMSNSFVAAYGNDVKALARADYERTKALADRFLRDEVRVIARLLIAQSILAPPQPQIQERVFTTRGLESSEWPK